MGAGPARERERSSRQDPRDLFVSLFWSSVSGTRGNGGAFRDRSSRPWALSFGHPWPNRSLQAPPLPRSLCSGTATGQLHPFRESARTFQFSKEPRDRVCPSRTVFGQGWPNAEPTWMYSWRVLEGPTRSRRGLSGERSLASRRVAKATLSRAGPAPTRPRLGCYSVSSAGGAGSSSSRGASAASSSSLGAAGSSGLTPLSSSVWSDSSALASTSSALFSSPIR